MKLNQKSKKTDEKSMTNQWKSMRSVTKRLCVWRARCFSTSWSFLINSERADAIRNCANFATVMALKLAPLGTRAGAVKPD